MKDIDGARKEADIHTVSGFNVNRRGMPRHASVVFIDALDDLGKELCCVSDELLSKPDAVAEYIAALLNAREIRPCCECKVADAAWAVADGSFTLIEDYDDGEPIISSDKGVQQKALEALEDALGEYKVEGDYIEIRIGKLTSENAILQEQVQRLESERTAIVDIAGRIVEDTVAANTALGEFCNVRGISLADAVRRRIYQALAEVVA